MVKCIGFSGPRFSSDHVLAARRYVASIAEVV
jgi:hypothetical protein